MLELWDGERAGVLVSALQDTRFQPEAGSPPPGLCFLTAHLHPLGSGEHRGLLSRAVTPVL